MKQQRNRLDIFSKTFSPTELDEVISNTKPGKAPGKYILYKDFFWNTWEQLLMKDFLN